MIKLRSAKAGAVTDLLRVSRWDEKRIRKIWSITIAQINAELASARESRDSIVRRAIEQKNSPAATNATHIDQYRPIIMRPPSNPQERPQQAQKILEPGVWAHRVKDRPAQCDCVKVTYEGFFKPGHGLVLHGRTLPPRRTATAALFGTRFVMESGLFGMVQDVDLVTPSAEDLDFIHTRYVELAGEGRTSESAFRKLTRIGQSLCSSQGVETIILAGTDFEALFQPSNTQFPALSCASLHFHSIMRYVMSATSPHNRELPSD